MTARSTIPAGRVRMRRARMGLVLALLVGAGVAFWWYQRGPLAAAAAAYRRQQWQTALDRAERLLRKEPGNLAARCLAGRCLYQLGRVHDAEETCYRWIPVQDQSNEDLRLRAEVLILRRSWPSAIEACFELHRRDPSDPIVLQRLSVMAFQVGDLVQAREMAEKLVTIPEHVAAASCILGIIHEIQDRPADAVSCFEKVLAADPAGDTLPILPEKVAWKLAANLRQMGHLTRARDVLEAWVQKNATAEFQAELADVYFALGAADRAATLWQEALARKPGFAPALVGLGKTALLQNRPALALENLLAAAQSGPPNGELHYLLSQAYARAGNLEQAAIHTKEADRLRQSAAQRGTADLLILQRPDSLAAQILLAQRAVELGNDAEAASLIQDLRQRAPHDARVQSLYQQWTATRKVPSSSRSSR